MLGLGLTRFLPRALARRVAAAGARVQRWAWERRGAALRGALQRGPGGPVSFAGQRVAILGLFRSRTGLGRAADLLALELRAEGAEVHLLDISAPLRRPVNLDRGDVGALADLDRLGADAVVIHVNPPEFLAVLHRIRRAAGAARTLVGAFAWELDRVPEEWRASVALLDQVWVPSPFVAEAVAATLPEAAPKVRVMGHRADLEPVPAEPGRRAAARAALGLAPDAFVALTSFSFFSTLARKNPQAAIEAFRLAFPEEGGAVHVVRCLDVEGYPPGMEVLRALAADDPRIRLVEVRERNASIEDAYAAADLYVSLHRSEGFGLNLAEALHRGLPVIATGWGLAPVLAGHPRLHAVRSRLVPVEDPQHVYDQVPGARWAEPDLDHAASLIRAVRARCSGPA